MKAAGLRVSAGADHKKPLRMLRVADDLELQLSTIIFDPRSTRRNPPDFEAIRTRAIRVLTDQPYECNRKIPEVDPVRTTTSKRITNATMTPDEILTITGMSWEPTCLPAGSDRAMSVSV